MNEPERRFYEKLREYLDDGFDLAKRQGNSGRALGFLMAIFQKIAASSFAAVRRTLERRLLMLTLHVSSSVHTAMRPTMGFPTVATFPSGPWNS